MFRFGNPVAGLGPLLPSIFVIATVIIHVAFALGVSRSCQKRKSDGRSTQLVSPGVWIFTTLFGGPIIACLYWIVNESGLNREAHLKREQ